VTLSSKGQLTIPRSLREAQGLVPGVRLQASIDAQGRLVLVAATYEPDDLFRDRPAVHIQQHLGGSQLLGHASLAAGLRALDHHGARGGQGSGQLGIGDAREIGGQWPTAG